MRLLICCLIVCYPFISMAGGRFSPPAVTATAADQWSNMLRGYTCLEVELFSVNRTDASTEEMARASSIPDEALERIQAGIVAALQDARVNPKITKADKTPCGGNAIVLAGTMTDYKKGKLANRIILGLGAGEQTFQALCTLKERDTGKILLEHPVAFINTYFYGPKMAERKFAERVASFVASGPAYQPTERARRSKW